MPNTNGRYDLRSRIDAWRMLVAAAMLLVLTVVSAGRNALWNSEVSVLRDTLCKSPGKERVHYNLGTALAKEGAYGEALGHFAAARTMNPARSAYHNQIANILYISGDRGSAIDSWRTAVMLDPGNVEAVFNLAKALDAAGKRGEAEGYYRRFLETARDEYAAQKDIARRRLTERSK